jgi:beta-galactosidase
VAAVGHRGGIAVSDSVEWTLKTKNINIAARQLTTGFMSGGQSVASAINVATGPQTTGSTSASTPGELFGSDNFFIGGKGDWLVSKALSAPMDRTPARGTDGPQLFKNFRRGAFSYFVPLDNGSYTVTLGFLEPDRDKQVGERIFDVAVNGETKFHNFDVLKTAGAYRTAVTKTFTTEVTNGYVKLDFTPSIGEAVVSNIRIRKQ